MTLRARLLHGIRSEQLLLVLIGTHTLLCAVLLGWETYITHAGRFLWPALWPPGFLAAWLACVAYHRDRSSRYLWRLSGSLALACYTSRAFIIGQMMLETEPTARLGLGIATWLMVAGVVEVSWVRVLYPRQED